MVTFQPPWVHRSNVADSDLAGRAGSDGRRRSCFVQIAKEPAHHSQYPRGPVTQFIPACGKTATKCEEPVKIGFVLLPGASRRTHASSFLIMPYIVVILALFGHFSTLMGAPAGRLGLRPCGSCRFCRQSIALCPDCQRAGSSLSVSDMLDHLCAPEPAFSGITIPPPRKGGPIGTMGQPGSGPVLDRLVVQVSLEVTHEVSEISESPR